MTAAKDIRVKIKSVTKTKKITTAMEMVAASKMRRAQDEMMAMRPYASKIRTLAHHVACADTETGFSHPYFVTQAPSAPPGFILISTDKGLCGGLNTSLFRFLVRYLSEHHHVLSDCFLGTIGTKGYNVFKRLGGQIVAHVPLVSRDRSFESILGVTRSLLALYNQGQIGSLFVVFNRFVNTMKQQPVIESLLPIGQQLQEVPVSRVQYLCEPNAQSILTHLLERYIETFVFESLTEHNSSEQSARMVAMKAAANNAGELIDQLNLAYNKSRQAAITKELSEIVSGSNAV